MLFHQKKTQNIVWKYHLVRAEPPFTVKTMTGCTRQDLGRKHSILLSVTHMLCVSQVCHGVAVQKVRVVLRQAWSKSQWIVLMGYLTIATNVRCYQTHHRCQFFFFQEDSAHVHCVCNTIQLSERCDFHVSPFSQVVQKHKVFEVA